MNNITLEIAAFFTEARNNSQYREVRKAARAAGISPRLLMAIERGRELMRDMRIYNRLCRAYGVTLKELDERVMLREHYR